MDEYQVSSRVERQTTDGLDNIRHAGLFARFVAFIVDLAILGVVFFGLLIFTQRVISENSPYTKKARDEFYSYNIDSGLYQKDEENDAYKVKTFDDYKGYQDMFYSYYTDYLVNKCPEKYRVSYDGKENYWFNVYVLGQSDELKLYEDKDLEKRHELVKMKGPELFTYKLDGDNKPLYDEIALPKCLNNNPEAEISEEDQKALVRYFYISDTDNTKGEYYYYYVATLDLTSRKFVQKAYDTWYNHYYSYPIVGSLCFSMSIFFILIPMLFKNGETLGKLVFHLGLVNKLGYRISRLQILPRYLFMMVAIVAFYFILGFSIWLMGIITLLALTSYTLSIFTKDHKAIHDYIAGTIVVDKVHSEIYQNAKQEDRIKNSINSVNSLFNGVEAPKEDSLLYENKNFNKEKNDKEG